MICFIAGTNINHSNTYLFFFAGTAPWSERDPIGQGTRICNCTRNSHTSGCQEKCGNLKHCFRDSLTYCHVTTTVFYTNHLLIIFRWLHPHVSWSWYYMSRWFNISNTIKHDINKWTFKILDFIFVWINQIETLSSPWGVCVKDSLPRSECLSKCKTNYVINRCGCHDPGMTSINNCEFK